jgi:hypothetical protein
MDFRTLIVASTLVSVQAYSLPGVKLLQRGLQTVRRAAGPAMADDEKVFYVWQGCATGEIELES